jgi:phosphate transport system protein
MPKEHKTRLLDTELEGITAHVLHMGQVVSKQLNRAMQALITCDTQLVDEVMVTEQELNSLEITIDAECSSIIVRHQPAARDLRLIMAISKTITNLERAGDEATKIAQCAKHIMASDLAPQIDYTEVKLAGEMANTLLRRALDAFASMDSNAADSIMHDDQALDDAFRAFVEKLISYVVANAHIISVALDFLFIAKAIERIGDHAKNIAEFTVYASKGMDIRHTESSSTAKS